MQHWSGTGVCAAAATTAATSHGQQRTIQVLGHGCQVNYVQAHGAHHPTQRSHHIFLNEWWPADRYAGRFRFRASGCVHVRCRRCDPIAINNAKGGHCSRNPPLASRGPGSQPLVDPGRKKKREALSPTHLSTPLAHWQLGVTDQPEGPTALCPSTDTGGICRLQLKERLRADAPKHHCTRAEGIGTRSSVRKSRPQKRLTGRMVAL
mmetsp:Transcript_7744/g.14852  ORF Transcript_7744/g.14852 Transcript_7744/m.14852 type:complete len:207 (+) Transcript_7744:144-764(+)